MSSGSGDLGSPNADAGDLAGVERVGAAQLRAALGVTPHQLGELTAGLPVAVGPRPNYPLYGRDAVRLMLAVQTLREIKAPLEVALTAVSDYAQEVIAGGGWLLVSPTEGVWAKSFVRTGPDLILWLRAVGGRGAVLDLDSCATRADQIWRTALVTEA